MTNTSEETLLIDKIHSIIGELYAKSPLITQRWENYAVWREQEDAIKKRIFEINKSVVPGATLGRVMRIPHADGYAMYWIYGVGKTSVKAQWLPIGDGWVSPVVSERGTVSKRLATLYAR